MLFRLKMKVNIDEGNTLSDQESDSDYEDYQDAKTMYESKKKQLKMLKREQKEIETYLNMDSDDSSN